MYHRRFGGSYTMNEPADSGIKADEPAAIAAFSTVEVVDNHIYFYAEVTKERILATIKAIREIDSRLRWERINREVPANVERTPIWLHINSGGGDLFAGFALSDVIKEIETPVYSISEGLCASAATLIAMSCQKRYALPNTVFLIHQLSAGIWGTHEQFKDELVIQQIMMDQLEKFYVAHSLVNAEELREMLKRDTWISSARALELKIIDGLYQRGQAV